MGKKSPVAGDNLTSHEGRIVTCEESHKPSDMLRASHLIQQHMTLMQRKKLGNLVGQRIIHDQAGADTVAADSLSPMLGRYIFGEGDHRALRRAISDARRLGDERRVRCSVDNRSAARRNHMRYRMLAGDHENKIEKASSRARGGK